MIHFLWANRDPEYWSTVKASQADTVTGDTMVSLDKGGGVGDGHVMDI